MRLLIGALPSPIFYTYGWILMKPLTSNNETNARLTPFPGASNGWKSIPNKIKVSYDASVLEVTHSCR